MAIRIATKLTAGIGATVYTVPAGKSATVSVQVQNPTGFLLAAQQTAISANPLVTSVGSNTANISAVFTESSVEWSIRNSKRTYAFNSTGGDLNQSGVIYQATSSGLTATNFNIYVYSPMVLDYRLSLSPNTVMGQDNNNGGIRMAIFNTSTPLNWATYPPNSSTGIAGRSGSITYYNVGTLAYNSVGMGFQNNGPYSRVISTGNPVGGTEVTADTTDSSSGQTNHLRNFAINNSYNIGYQAMDIVHTGTNQTAGVFWGLYKSAAAPAIAVHNSWSQLANSGRCDYTNIWTLTGPANGTCPMWMRAFPSNNTYYFGMSDGTVWKTTGTNIFQYTTTGSSTSRGALTCTQVTIPADVDITIRPYVASPTQMFFGTTGTYPKVMSTSDVFTDYPNATYPTELAFASATVPNPKTIFKYGSTVNEYTIVDATTVYKTSANYAAITPESYLINGRTGDFERTGLVLNSGDKLIAVEPTDNNCIVTVYGYEE